MKSKESQLAVGQKNVKRSIKSKVPRVGTKAFKIYKILKERQSLYQVAKDLKVDPGLAFYVQKRYFA